MQAFALQVLNGFAMGLGIGLAVFVMRALFHFNLC